MATSKQSKSNQIAQSKHHDKRRRCEPADSGCEYGFVEATAVFELHRARAETRLRVVKLLNENADVLGVLGGGCRLRRSAESCKMMSVNKNKIQH